MSFDIINNSPEMLNMWIQTEKAASKAYQDIHPDSLIPLFESELRALGFEFEITNQTLVFLPKHKKLILPIAVKYYQQAKQKLKYDEQNHFISYFRFSGFDEVVPMLLTDFCASETHDLTKWFLADCIYQIRSKKFADDYLGIISDPTHGQNRQMFILLVGKLKIDPAIPVLIDLLNDETVRLHAIKALGDYKREDLRSIFQAYENSKHPGWRKYAKAALKKLET